MSKSSIANFERGATVPQERTLRDLRTAFETAGVEFLDNEEEGIGVKMQSGVMEPKLVPDEKPRRGKTPQKRSGLLGRLGLF